MEDVNNMPFVIQLVTIILLFHSGRSENIQGSVDASSFDVAVLLPSTGDWTVGRSIASAPMVAIQKIIDDLTLPHAVDWEWKDTNCNALEGTKMLMELWDSATDLDAIIGGGCSVVCKPVALLAAAFDIPFVSFGCNDDSLSDKTTYPTFTRTVGPWSSLATMLDKLFEYLNWTTRVGIASGPESVMTNTAAIFRDKFEKPSASGHTQKVVEYRTLDTTGGMTSRQLAVYMKSRTRIIIVMMYGADLRAFLLACRDEGMMNGEYGYITIDADLTVAQNEQIRPEDVVTSYNGILNLHITKPTGADWDAFATKVVNHFSDAKFPPSSTIGDTADIALVDVHAGMLHDAFLAWAYGVEAAIADNAAHLDNGPAITNHIINGQPFQGVSGQIVFDSNGNRKPDYTVSIVQNLGNTPLFEYSERTQTLSKVYRPGSETDFRDLEWKGGRTGPPSSEPKCGWHQEHCPDKKIALKVTLSLLFVLAFLAGVGYLLYRRRKYLLELNDLSLWKITVRDMSDSRIHTQLMATRALLRARTRTTLTDDHEALCNVVTIGGKLCTVKTLNRPSVDVTDKNILLEMKKMRDMKHANINPFVAAVCDHPNVAICMLYAEKGSLQDVLYNDDVNLTVDFKMSLAIDIAKGLSYMHTSPFGSHGNLTSSNCVVDSRWVCKLTDYGAAHFRKGHRSSDRQLTKSKLWKAPEMLDTSISASESPYGTREGDVYSYGIILSEIITRDRPFCHELEEMEVRDIVQRVSERHIPTFRPHMDPNIAETNTDWVQLMTLCWADDPVCRPTVGNIIQSLKDINGKRTFEPVEKMLTLMEDHSQRLEELLAARNDELDVEKKRVNNLLNNLLPPSVADELMHGRAVKAQVFDNVSVCYVQILNLDSIIAKASPDKLTEALTTVFQQFDLAASQCDIFKLDTATNGELFVNGCPEPKEDHEAEMMQLAAALVMSVDDDSDWPLIIKLGVHAGSLVAGIVGLTVPRYCFFGEVLHVAIRLAETSEPLTIHASQQIAEKILPDLYIVNDGPGLNIAGYFTRTFFITDV